MLNKTNKILIFIILIINVSICHIMLWEHDKRLHKLEIDKLEKELYVDD